MLCNTSKGIQKHPYTHQGGFQCVFVEQLRNCSVNTRCLAFK